MSIVLLQKKLKNTAKKRAFSKTSYSRALLNKIRARTYAREFVYNGLKKCYYYHIFIFFRGRYDGQMG